MEETALLTKETTTTTKKILNTKPSKMYLDSTSFLLETKHSKYHSILEGISTKDSNYTSGLHIIIMSTPRVSFCY